MGFLDNLRDRFGGGYNDDYDDDYYDDYDDDEIDDEPTGSGILGNTSRPEAESVSVYTRSGRPVGNNAGGQSGSSAPSRPSSSYSSYRRSNDDFDDLDEYAPTPAPAPAPKYTPSSASSLNASGQLPPYVLRAEAYEDVQTVVRRVRTNQPVLLVLDDTDPAVAQRILDFSFGLSFGIGGEVRPVDAKAFVVLPAGIQVSQSEVDRLLSQVK